MRDATERSSQRRVFGVEKGIPYPARAVSPSYPFSEMEVGDSFFVPRVTLQSLHRTARLHRPRKFLCRTVIESGVRGFRVWRMA